MNKSLIYIAGVALVLGVGILVITNSEKSPVGTFPTYKDIAYTIDGTPVLLKDGSAETDAAPGSASKTTTRYFGNEAQGDLNGDTIPDIAFLLTQNTGGTGTFYYVVAALQTDSGYYGTNAVLLGDRIAPQTTEIRNGELTVNYAVRKEGAPMTESPSVGVSKYLKVSGNELLEITK